MAAPTSTHSYGADPTQFVDCFVPTGIAPTGGWPTVILIAASGFSAVPTSGIWSNATQLNNTGCAAFCVSYRGDTSVAPIIPAFPMEINDIVAGAQWILAHASTFGTSASTLHFIGGSAGGTLAGLAAAELLDLGINVASVQLLSSNTDWESALQYYFDAYNNPSNHPELGTPAQAKALAATHIGNIANAYGVTSSQNTSTAGIGSLQWHDPNSGVTNSTPPTGSDIWTGAHYAEYSVAQRASRKATRCWWNLYNSAQEEIPLQQPYYLMETLTNVGTMATLTIVPGSTHGWSLWPTGATAWTTTALTRFILQTNH